MLVSDILPVALSAFFEPGGVEQAFPIRDRQRLHVDMNRPEQEGLIRFERNRFELLDEVYLRLD